MSKNQAGLSLESSRRVKQTILTPYTIPPTPGCYTLILENPHSQTLSVGKLDLITFPSGVYAYVGSAMGGLSKRISRYLKEIKRPHWHIDRLMPVFHLKAIWVFPSPIRQECYVAQIFAQTPGVSAIPGFGSTDCSCPSHLFTLKKNMEAPLFTNIKEALPCGKACKIVIPEVP